MCDHMGKAARVLAESVLSIRSAVRAATPDQFAGTLQWVVLETERVHLVADQIVNPKRPPPGVVDGARKGGETTRARHGPEHYRAMQRRSAEARRARGAVE